MLVGRRRRRRCRTLCSGILKYTAHTQQRINSEHTKSFRCEKRSEREAYLTRQQDYDGPSCGRQRWEECMLYVRVKEHLECSECIYASMLYGDGDLINSLFVVFVRFFSSRSLAAHSRILSLSLSCSVRILLKIEYRVRAKI